MAHLQGKAERNQFSHGALLLTSERHLSIQTTTLPTTADKFTCLKATPGGQDLGYGLDRTRIRQISCNNGAEQQTYMTYRIPMHILSSAWGIQVQDYVIRKLMTLGSFAFNQLGKIRPSYDSMSNSGLGALIHLGRWMTALLLELGLGIRICIQGVTHYEYH